MIDAIDHVVLTSSNLENTLNFYCKVLGMKLKKELIKEDGSIRHSLHFGNCLLYTSPSPRDLSTSRMPSSA